MTLLKKLGITLKLTMINIVVLLLLAVLSNCQIESDDKDEYDNIGEVIANLTRIHENPAIATHRELLETAILYLDKLLFLEDEVKGGMPKAERMICKLHREGAYEQLENVPFSILIGHYGWNSLAVGEYENIIHRAKEIWRYFLDEINYGSIEKEDTTLAS